MPNFGEVCAFSESSATPYVTAVWVAGHQDVHGDGQLLALDMLGDVHGLLQGEVGAAKHARSNRESANSALCAAVTGCVPEYGLLLDENRKGDIVPPPPQGGRTGR